MSLSTTGFPNREGLKNTGKVTTLNPNAAEFVPSALRSTSGNGRNTDLTRLDMRRLSGEAVSSHSKYSISNKSDDEAQGFWDCQLPDDITPDFKVIAKDEQSSGQQSLDSLVGLLLHDVETSDISAAVVSQSPGALQEISLHDPDGHISSEELCYSGSCYDENQSSSAFLTSATNNWGHELGDDDLHYISGKEENHYTGDNDALFLDNFSKKLAVSEDTVINPLQYLVSQFPGFSDESLAGVYYANECNLKVTIEILAQFEMQVDGSFYQSPNLKVSTAPSLSMLGFPASEAQNGLYYPGDIRGASNAYSSSTPFSGAINLSSPLRKLASQSGSSKIEKKGAENCNVGSSRGSQVLAEQSNVYRELAFGNKLQGASSSQETPIWLETGETVGNMYSASREEARDFARLRNACFQQASQAYLIGNKALAKELGLKGQYYDMQMKAAHGKAREAIYQQRNPGTSDLQGYGQGQDRLIDLHGLHVTEAIHILKFKLSILRIAARSAGQRLKVMICVGTGHHTKGSRTPARLPIAVEQFLVEEGLHYTQPQPGLLCVVIY